MESPASPTRRRYAELPANTAPTSTDLATHIGTTRASAQLVYANALSVIRPLSGDAVVKEPVEGAPGERGDGVGAFVVGELAVGQP